MGRAASTLPQLPSLGPRAGSAPRVLVGTCQELCCLPKYSPAHKGGGSCWGVGMAKLPEFRPEASSGAQSVLGVKHSAGAAGRDGGDVSISKAPCAGGSGNHKVSPSLSMWEGDTVLSPLCSQPALPAGLGGSQESVSWEFFT